jgi:hypothetical protein
MKNEFGDNPDLIRQALADLNTQQRQDARNNFEARLMFVNQVAAHKAAAMDGIREYGLQTLKWSFLLNAGAIAIVLAYIGALVGKSPNVSLTTFAPVIKSLWPFALGCVSVVLAGAMGFFNFSYAEAVLPPAEALYTFLQPTSQTWPLGRFQLPEETPAQFYHRFSWKVSTTRMMAVALALGSAFFFVYGIYRVFRAVLA